MLPDVDEAESYDALAPVTLQRGDLMGIADAAMIKGSFIQSNWWQTSGRMLSYGRRGIYLTLRCPVGLIAAWVRPVEPAPALDQASDWDATTGSDMIQHAWSG